MSAAEVAGLPLGQRLSFLMPDDQNLVLVEFGEPGEHRPVVAKRLVAVEFDELVEHEVQIVARFRAIGVPRDLDRLPGVEAAEDLLLNFDELPLEPSELLRLLAPKGRGLQGGNPVLDLVDRLLERQSMQSGGHRCRGSGEGDSDL